MSSFYGRKYLGNWLLCCWPMCSALGLVLGVALALTDTWSLFYSLAIALLLALGAALVEGWGSQALLSCLLLVGSACWGWQLAQRELVVLRTDSLRPWTQQRVAIRGYWQEYPRSKAGRQRGRFCARSVVALADGMDDISRVSNGGDKRWTRLPRPALLLATLRGNGVQVPYEPMVIVGRLCPIENTEGSSFDYRSYCAAQGIYWRFNVRQLLAVGEERSLRVAFWRSLAHWRRQLTQTVSRRLPPEESELFLGMVLGESSRLRSELKAQFQSVGVAHILAASGMHLGLVAAAVFLLTRLGGWSRRVAVWPCALAITLYAAFVGFTPSILRAWLMALLSLGALVCGRPVSLGRVLALVGCGTLLCCPLALAQVGFQLSYAAVLGIAIWCKPLQRAVGYLLRRRAWSSGRLWRWIGDGLALSVSVTLAIAPLLIFHFHQLAWLAWVANLLVLPLAEIIMLSGLGALALEPLGLGCPLWWICRWALTSMICAVRCIAGWGVVWSVPSVPRAAGLVYVFVLLGMRLLWPEEKNRAAASVYLQAEHVVGNSEEI